MAVAEYYRTGEVAILTGTFVDDDGDPVDPTALAFEMTEPDGTITNWSYASNPDKVIQDSTGVYYVAWPVDQMGPHTWKMIGTGSNPGSLGGKFSGYY